MPSNAIRKMPRTLINGGANLACPAEEIDLRQCLPFQGASWPGRWRMPQDLGPGAVTETHRTNHFVHMHQVSCASFPILPWILLCSFSQINQSGGPMKCTSTILVLLVLHLWSNKRDFYSPQNDKFLANSWHETWQKNWSLMITVLTKIKQELNRKLSF